MSREGRGALARPGPTGFTTRMSSSTATGTEFSGEIPAEVVELDDLPPGIGPYALAWRRLRRNKLALAFGALFVVIVVLCLLAPAYANDIAHTGPNDEHITQVIKVGGKPTDVVSVIGIPIGPTWHSQFLLGADSNGRDVAVRALYGGRNSLEIGFIATIITMVLAILLGVAAGYFRGKTDGVITRVLDIMWAYPAVLLGVALGATLAVGGIDLGLFTLHGNSLAVPAVVIGIVYVPYVAKPIRGQVLMLREREFIDAARQQGLSHRRIMTTEVLPNVVSTIIVFFPLMLANAILLEAALSYLGAGVQPPNPSWGTMISAGVKGIPAAFHLVLVPGIMLVLTVLSINIFGDGLRDALDPRAKVRISH
jgi:peptide/nickel transport system permease protein